MTPPHFDLTFSQLPNALYAESLPDPIGAPEWLLQNSNYAESIGISKTWLGAQHALELFSGIAPPKGYQSIAMAYAGHQFGHLSPRLGDGRAVLIGEYVDPNGVRLDLHLKGSGKTPFSRRGDGKSTLRAALKEYMFSESFAALGIPTTRSLGVILTGETVQRERGHPGAVLIRTARSHIRVGSFQWAAGLKDESILKELADYTIDREYSEISDNDLKYRLFLESVISRQAKLIALWMSSGFIHGVMNTDNMAISGETIDFGPCAFMDGFQANQVYSSIDRQGRYAWNRQAEMAVWNLTRFAETLLPLLSDDMDTAVAQAEDSLAKFMPEFLMAFRTRMMSKLGLVYDPESQSKILPTMFALLQDSGADFTSFFSALTRIANGDEDHNLLAVFNEPAAPQPWLSEWKKERKKLDKKTEAVTLNMQWANPVYIPRTYLLEEALTQANLGDMRPFNQMLTAVQNPYIPDIENMKFAAAPPKEQVHIPTYCET